MPNPSGTFNITYRTLSAGPLTNAQVDANFQALQDYALHLSGGTLTGPLFGTTATFSGTVSVAAPTSAGHAATKNYVDTNFLSAGGTGSVTNSNISDTAAIAYSKLNLTGSIVNADVSASAAIAYSKLNLVGNVKNADVSASAAIAYSKLNLANAIVNGDISTTAAIAYSKLNLTGAIVNNDIATGAAIAYAKLNLASSIKNTDVSASAAIAYSKLALTGSILNADIANTAAIAYSKLNLTGSIVNTDISASAAIADTKLATITTAGKVSNSATTATSANTNSAIVARDSSGGFVAGGVQTTSFGVGTAPSGIAGEIRATNEITAYYASDINLKENVRELDSALDKLEQIRGVEFDWKDDYIESRGGEDGFFVRKKDVGLIAQEIESVLPQAVGVRQDGNLAVRYEKVIPLLVEAVKELNEKIN